MKVLIPAAVVVLAVVGSVGFGAAAGGKGAASFLVAYLLALVVAGFATAVVMVMAKLSPAISLFAAMMNYALTVLVFVVALKKIDRDEVHQGAAVCGLLASLIPYLMWQFWHARVRPVTDAERASVERRSGEAPHT